MKWIEKHLKGKSNKSISDDNTTIKATVQKIENFYWLREWHSCAMNVVGNKKRTVAVILS